MNYKILSLALFISIPMTHFAAMSSAYENRLATDTIVPKEVSSEELNEPVYSFAEEMPIYPGGESALYSAIASSTTYPDFEREAGISGTVIVQFIIEKDGSISNVEVARGVSGGPGLSYQASKAIQSLKSFQPARNQGKTVRLKMLIPIKFTLADDSSESRAEKENKSSASKYHFDGGQDAFDLFLKKNLTFPKEALKGGEATHQVRVRFVIDSKGRAARIESVSTFQESPFKEDFEKEAARLVKKAKWIPSKIGQSDNTEKVSVLIDFEKKTHD